MRRTWNMINRYSSDLQPDCLIEFPRWRKPQNMPQVKPHQRHPRATPGERRRWTLQQYLILLNSHSTRNPTVYACPRLPVRLNGIARPRRSWQRWNVSRGETRKKAKWELRIFNNANTTSQLAVEGRTRVVHVSCDLLTIAQFKRTQLVYLNQ